MNVPMPYKRHRNPTRSIRVSGLLYEGPVVCGMNDTLHNVSNLLNIYYFWQFLGAGKKESMYDACMSVTEKLVCQAPNVMVVVGSCTTQQQFACYSIILLLTSDYFDITKQYCHAQLVASYFPTKFLSGVLFSQFVD